MGGELVARLDAQTDRIHERNNHRLSLHAQQKSKKLDFQRGGALTGGPRPLRRGADVISAAAAAAAVAAQVIRTAPD